MDNPICTVYAVLKEVNSKRSTTVCGGKQFIQEYTVEDGDSLEVRVLGPMSKTDGTPAQFLIQYQGLFALFVRLFVMYSARGK